MKKVIILLITASLFVACTNKKKSDGKANASMIEASQNGSLKKEQATPYVLIVNYNLKEMSIEEHAELGANVAPNFTPEKIEGLIGKSFIGNTDTGVYGGVYQFSSKEAAEKYITSAFWLGIEAHPNLVNFTKEMYAVPPFSNKSNGMWANRKTSTNPADAMGMHLLVVKYNLKEMTLEEHQQLGVDVSPNFTAEKIEGFIGKSFIGNTDTGVFGGVYHFKSKEAVDTYLKSEFWEGIENHPNLVNFTKEIYGIAPISAISNGIPML
jgi:hypothetical protein